jgi:hypothetical protein
MRSAGLGQAANGVGNLIWRLNLALFPAASNIVATHAASVAVLLADLFLALRMPPLGPLGTEVR